MPNRFKTPGTGAPLVSGDGNNVVVIDAATRAELVALRREALDAMALNRLALSSNYRIGLIGCFGPRLERGRCKSWLYHFGEKKSACGHAVGRRFEIWTD